MSEIRQMNPSTFVLARGELAALRSGGRECRVSCVAGRVWVTASGCREDVVLEPGNHVAYTRKGRIVVEALKTATVRVEIRAAAGQKAGVTPPLQRLPAGLFR